MQIIILGAGQVGSSLVTNLVTEQHDVTVVDNNFDHLAQLHTKLDIRTVCGHASYPDILAQAGADDADLLIAVTNSDEINMLACQVAYSLFKTPTKIARLRAPEFLRYSELFCNESIPINVCINPEELVTNYLCKLIKHPGALDVLEFAEGHLQVISFKIDPDSLLIGQPIASINQLLPTIKSRTAALYRGDRSIPISGATTLQAGDEIFLLAEQKHIDTVLFSLGRHSHDRKRIVIASAGNIGGHLAKKLEQQHHVKLIDHNLQHIHRWDETLKNTTLLHGEACDKALLTDENIEAADFFFALTNDDESNIMSCLLAKQLGAKQVIALVNRLEYVDLIENSAIDIAFSPHQTTIGKILTYVRHADALNVYSLRRGAAEAIELVAHGDKDTSKVVGRKIGEIDFPPGTNVGAVYRDSTALIAHSDLVIMPQDHVILFVMNKAYISAVEKLFQVSATYF